MESNLNLQPVAEEQPLGFLSKLVKIFTSPTEVLENISHYPKILMPLIYSSVIMIITYFIRMPLLEITQKKVSDLYLQKYGIDMSQNLQASDSINYISAFLAPISIIVMWAIGGLFLWLLVKIFGGKSSVKQILSLYAHVMMISVTGSLIAAPIGLLLNTDIIIFSPVVFMPNGDISSFLYNFLMLAEVFSIWSMIIAGLGISILNEFSKVKGIVISMIYLIIGNALTALIAILPYLTLNLYQNM
ncbi:YIP1 family protein [Defluviitalea raffinosedens]|uniref:Yip1 domain-containing protein n=1 Tax=Defluviitalea raffinosedens TaxID=1450156 RepID=A0A7C8LL86_9FIRM|nr:YIP1 family protein [Defluviitalea raffinosedens]KAE9637144.1 hypothetical protein GND95_01565 [Defluviitalea raffinosedens]MBM7686554.1 hypothetical protein [Defluviitalea raffinosedens]